MVVDAEQLQSNRLHDRLLWRIMQTYAVVSEPVQVGPIAFEFTRVADPNVVLEAIAAAEKRLPARATRELHLPYWAELWASSLGLAHFLVHEWVHCGAGESWVAAIAREQIRPAAPARAIAALDLGCGMGFVGAAAARLGMHVLFADIETPALMFAALNSLPDRPRCRCRKVNWQTDRLGEQFDLILGADIVYERPQWPFLDTFFQVHLAPGGSVLIGEPGRSTGDDFEPWIIARGWSLRRFSQRVPGGKDPIELLQLTRA